MPAPGTRRTTAPIATGTEWTVPLLERFDVALAAHAGRLQLDTYPIQYEVITAAQMIDLCSTVGMPVHYAHWSFGKQLLGQEHSYKKGMSGLAYEIVINTSPALVYLMETNTLPLQVLVMAHAAYGHNAFFKSNYLFRQFTQADGILDYLTFARNFILDCEERHGWREVERILDCCHALAPYGIDRYKKPTRLSASRERERLAERLRFAQLHYNADVAYLYEGAEAKPDPAAGSFDPQENLLYFIEKSAPKLAPWQRELVRIVRKISQYFYPQRLTRVANEGAATFWHYTLLHELYDHGAGRRRLHAGVAFQSQRCRHPALLRCRALPRHQSVRSRVLDLPRYPSDLRTADGRGPRMVPAAGGDRLGRGRALCNGQFQGRKPDRAVPVAEGDA